MGIYRDIHQWDKLQAALISDEGANANERLIRRARAAQQMQAIEAAYEYLPGGFQAERARAKARVKKIVDGAPPLTDDQLVELSKLLHQP
jgi:hypothetical protein